jgi:ribonuclease HI
MSAIIDIMTDSTKKLPMVTITTDGAATPNPGPGGWAALLQSGGRERLLAGAGPDRTTNNAMEIYAVAVALETLKRPCHVTLRIDSTYVLEGLKRLLDGRPLPDKNHDLWQRLLAAARPHEIEFEWVRGHTGDPRNERVDQAANTAAARAYRAEQALGDTSRCAEEWTLAVVSAAADRPVRWTLITPSDRRSGAVAVRNMTQPTAVYHALVAGLTAAQELPDAASAALRIVSNYQLIVNQGRGEWRVKNPDQRALAAQVGELRSTLCAVQFEFAPTDELLTLFMPATGE